jgi:hypothetical protein
MCNVYVAVRLIQLHPLFITVIFILSSPWQKLPSPRPSVNKYWGTGSKAARNNNMVVLINASAGE